MSINKQMEINLRQMSKVFMDAADPILIENMEGIVIDMNAEVERSYGWSREELLGKPIKTLVPPERHEQADELLSRCRAGEEVRNIEGLRQTKTGDVIPVLLTLSRLTGEERGATGIATLCKDISVQTQAMEKLEKSRIQLEASLHGTIDAVAKLVEARDPYTAGHELRVATIACAIAQEMGLEEAQIEGIKLGGTIHDIGKINLPAEILSKPTRITEVEYLLIKTHPQVGYDILKDIDFPWPVAEIAHQHHERMNGSGYPQGLKGDEICLEAWVVAVGDVVEAIGSHRPYRPALGIDVALKEIKDNRGKFYDPVVVDACLKIFTEKNSV